MSDIFVSLLIILLFLENQVLKHEPPLRTLAKILDGFALLVAIALAATFLWK